MGNSSQGWCCGYESASAGGPLVEGGRHWLVTGMEHWQRQSWKVPLGVRPLEVAINPTIEPIASLNLL